MAFRTLSLEGGRCWILRIDRALWCYFKDFSFLEEHIDRSEVVYEGSSGVYVLRQVSIEAAREVYGVSVPPSVFHPHPQTPESEHLVRVRLDNPTERIACMNELIVVPGTVIPPNASCTIQVISVKGAFRLKNMMVPPEIAPFFLITDIKIGRMSQLASIGAVCADYFALQGGSEDLQFDDLRLGEIISVSVTKRGSSPLEFSATLRGELIPERRRRVVGFGDTLVAPRSEARITVQSQSILRLDTLVVSPSTATTFKIHSLEVAGDSVLFEESRGIHSGENEFCPAIAQTGDWIKISVENLTDSAEWLYGIALSGQLLA